MSIGGLMSRMSLATAKAALLFVAIIDGREAPARATASWTAPALWRFRPRHYTRKSARGLAQSKTSRSFVRLPSSSQPPFLPRLKKLPQRRAVSLVRAKLNRINSRRTELFRQIGDLLLPAQGERSAAAR